MTRHSSLHHYARLCVAVLLSGAVLSAQAMPVPTNTNLWYFGYYHADGKFGDYTSDVFQYTNMYVTDHSFAVDTSDSDWQTPYYSELENAAAAGKHIMLLTTGETGTIDNQTYTTDEILDLASDFWDNVTILNVRDDVSSLYTAEYVDDDITYVKGLLDDKSLSYKPFMEQFTASGALYGNGMAADSLDIVGIDTFDVDILCGNSSSVVSNVAAMKSDLETTLTRVHNAGKQAIITMMAFDRSKGDNDSSGACQSWRFHTPSLEALQDMAYFSAATDTAVIGITMFAYANQFSGHVTGTLGYPNLEMRHRRMAAAMNVNYAFTEGGIITGCSDYVEWAPVYEEYANDCRSYCVSQNADSCVWHANGECYVAFGNGCYIQGGHYGWNALLFNFGQMEEDSEVSGCSDFTESSPVYKATVNQCLSYCIENSANACEYNDSNGDCYVDFGTGCHVERTSGRHATLLTPGIGSGG